MALFGKPSQPKSQVSKPSPAKPKTMFEQKRDWESSAFTREVAKNPLSIGGRGFTEYERKKVLQDVFKGRGTHINAQDVRDVQRKLRKEANTGSYEQRIAAQKKLDLLQKSTGIKI